MKAKVRLTYSVELFVEGKSEEVIQDWLDCTTPEEAKNLATKRVREDYSEEILLKLDDNTPVDYTIPS
jgi:hypothetical protein